MRRALAFLTPLGGAASPDARTLSWFPVAGAVIGGALGVIWWSANEVWPTLVAAVVVVVADLVLTGLLHVDGLADSADGLLPQLPRERRLALMAEPAIGTYGAVAVAVALLLRTSSLAAIQPDALLLAAIWCASRTAMAVIARALPYARGEGLATSFLGGSWLGVAIGGSIAALGLGFLADGGVGLLSVIAALGASSLVALIALRRLGGYTGDVLGAAGVIGETVALLVAAGSW